MTQDAGKAFGFTGLGCGAAHHGAGAGFGVEDALVLATVLEDVDKLEGKHKTAAVREALQVHKDVRYERTQWLVKSNRATGDFYTWRGDPNVGSNFEKFASEIEWRSRHIWYYDVEGMAREVLPRWRRRQMEPNE